jgi:hypothetical protein
MIVGKPRPKLADPSLSLVVVVIYNITAPDSWRRPGDGI